MPSQYMNRLAARVHDWARRKGFYDRERTKHDDINPSLPSEKLLLIVSEVAEVQDALRDGNKAHEAEELADVLIRVLDYAAWRGIDLDDAVYRKMEINQTRAQLHGRAAF
jgi:NTP pyrophosphatase (non-canonical NTP hydrolase)